MAQRYGRYYKAITNHPGKTDVTAEVAILNKTAIAVAADSAVTVGKTKVHRSTTKIFALTPDIGAMIYGYSELGGMPWEILLKLFRAEHGADSFLTVEACYQTLHAFLSEPRFKLEEGSLDSLVRFAIEVIEYVKEHASEAPKESLTIENLTTMIDTEIRSYTDLEPMPQLAVPDISVFTTEAQNIIQAVADNIFEDFDYQPPPELLPKLVELVATALNSSYASDYASGLVVFGFGRDELFPHLVENIYDCVPLGVLRRIQTRSTDALSSGATIIPLADREVMDTLIQGTDDHLHSTFVEAASQFAKEIADRIIKDNLPSSEHVVAMDLAKRAIADVKQNLEENSQQYIHATYVRGMIATIENMPKEDLAVLAEALVEVTALRIKASERVESVAGPVDVCVVTKGDGLIWTKRKHYFDLNKNLQYLHRRYGRLPGLPNGDSNDHG